MLVEAGAVHNQQNPEATTGSNSSEKQIFPTTLVNTEIIITPEQYFKELGASERSSRWALINTPNSNAEFIRMFAQTKEHLEANFFRKNVAVHELGHAHVVRMLGHEVSEISIIPNGNVLGFTRFRLRALRDLVQYITHRIACAAGSRIAEEKAGIHDHSGCCGDDATIKHLASEGERITRGAISSGWLESEGRKLASSAMASYPSISLEKDAHSLLKRHPVTVMGKTVTLERLRLKLQQQMQNARQQKKAA